MKYARNISQSQELHSLKDTSLYAIIIYTVIEQYVGSLS